MCCFKFTDANANNSEKEPDSALCYQSPPLSPPALPSPLLPSPARLSFLLFPYLLSSF